MEHQDYNSLIQGIRKLRLEKKYEEMYQLCVLYYPLFSEEHEFMNETAMCLYKMDKYESAWNVYQRILSQCVLTHAQSLIYNHYAFLSYRYVESPPPDEHMIQRLTLPKQIRWVTFSITSCKRLDLFIRTMNSFLYYCRDTDLICRWICVDDNSSEEDRLKMRELYPFFEFVWKTEGEKGHAESMNKIMDMVDTPYLFHMEDDWEFFTAREYIKDCLNVLQEDPLYGQCLINRNYGETMEDLNLYGGIPKQTRTNIRYVEHQYKQVLGKEDTLRRTNMYWPHYSLRPGMNRISTLKTIGEYSLERNHFEMEFARRYTSQGYKTCFLDSIYCTHIGKLTTEKIPNAYTLNGEKQF